MNKDFLQKYGRIKKNPKMYENIDIEESENVAVEK